MDLADKEGSKKKTKSFFSTQSWAPFVPGGDGVVEIKDRLGKEGTGID